MKLRQVRTRYVIGIIPLLLMLTRTAFSDNFTYADISDAVVRTHSQVRDMNRDGKVNCVDYSLTFKSIWEAEHGKGSCVLMKNHNDATGMHHMFVKVRHTYNVWTYVEPQGTADNWTPYSVWGRRYSPYRNIKAE